MATKSTAIYQSLEEKITDGTYKPGDRLPSEAELCQQFKVSRGPVRTALDKLMAIGLIFKKKGGGSYVSEQSSDDYLNVLLPNLRFNTGEYTEVLELRSALERLSIGKCLENHEENDYASLDSIVDSLNEGTDPDSFFDLERTFHLLVSEMAGNRLLHHMNLLAWNLLGSCPRERYLQGDIRIHVDELTAIHSALRHNDGELAVLYSNRRLNRIISRDRASRDADSDAHRWNPWLADTL